MLLQSIVEGVEGAVFRDIEDDFPFGEWFIQCGEEEFFFFFEV